jgi:uncharacterized membrane protein
MVAYINLAAQAQRTVMIALLMMLSIVAFNTLISPSGGRQPNWVVWIALSIPLLIVLPGIVRGGINSFIWLGFVSLLYFAEAVTAVMSPAARIVDWLHLLVSIALFVGALLFVRWRARANRAAA